MDSRHDVSYSTLEVDHSRLPEVLRCGPREGEKYYHVGPLPNGSPEPLEHHKSDPENFTPTPNTQARLLGLKRRTFFIILACIFVVVVGALVGGLVGGSKKKASDASSGAVTTNTNTSSPIRAESGITALNYTDESNNEYRMVFWQNITGRMHFSLWDSQNKTWEITDIAAHFPQGGMVEAKNATAMAATVQSSARYGRHSSFVISLAYISITNELENILTEDVRGKSWHFSGLLNAHRQQVGDNSQLGSVWNICPTGCTGAIFILYEDKQQNMMLLNSTDSWKPDPVTVAKGIVAGSGIAVALVANPNGTHSMNANSMRIFYDTSDITKEELWTPDKSFSSTSLSDRIQRNGVPQMASMSFATAATRSSPLNVMTIFAFPDGTVKTNSWDDSTWQGNIDPSINSKPSDKMVDKWRAVSIASDMRIYALTTQNEIHSFTVPDLMSPWIWSYEAAVPTS